MKTIQLTRGQVVMVSDADYKRLSAFKWQASWMKCGFYAMRMVELESPGPYRRKRKTVMMHHDVMGGPWDGFEIHHKNTNTLDNQRTNLEKLPILEHRHRSRKQSKPSRSKFLGVTRFNERWVAQLFAGHVRTRTAFFHDEIAAAKQYDAWVLELRGPNATRNFL